MFQLAQIRPVFSSLVVTQCAEFRRYMLPSINKRWTIVTQLKFSPFSFQQSFISLFLYRSHTLGIIAIDSGGIRDLISTLISLFTILGRTELGIVAIESSGVRNLISTFNFLFAIFSRTEWGTVVHCNRLGRGQRSHFNIHLLIRHLRSHRVGNGHNRLGRGQKCHFNIHTPIHQ